MIRHLQFDVHENAAQKGFYDGVQITPTEIASRLALIHSEVSEALEALRDGQLTTSVTESGKPVGFPSELADVVIRCLDLAGWLGIDLEKEIVQKHAYNQTRSRKHGGKAL